MYVVVLHCVSVMLSRGGGVVNLKKRGGGA